MSIDRKIGLELRDGENIGRDPKQVTAEKPRALGHSPMSPLKALRLGCIDCCAGSSLEVRRCTALNCPAWPFRMGWNPWRAPASEGRRQLGRDLAARRPRGVKNQRQGRGSAETEEGAATTLPDAIDGEKSPVNLVGEEDCA